MNACALLVSLAAAAAAPSPARGGTRRPSSRPISREGLVLEQSTSHSFRSMVGMVKQEDDQVVHLAPAGVRVQTMTPGPAGTPQPRGSGAVPSKFYTIFRIEPARKASRPKAPGSKAEGTNGAGTKGAAVPQGKSSAGKASPGGAAGGGAADGGDDTDGSPGADDAADAPPEVVRIEVNGFRRTYLQESLAARAARNAAARRAVEERIRKLQEGGAGGPLGGLAGLMGGAAPPGPSGAAGPGGRDSAADAPAETVEVKRTGETKTVAGRKCRRYEFHRAGEKMFEAWYTEKPAPKWVRRFDLDESPGGADAALMEARRSVPGLELESVLYLPAGGRREVRTLKITVKPIPDSLFMPPQGYRKRAPPKPAGHSR